MNEFLDLAKNFSPPLLAQGYAARFTIVTSRRGYALRVDPALIEGSPGASDIVLPSASGAVLRAEDGTIRVSEVPELSGSDENSSSENERGPPRRRSPVAGVGGATIGPSVEDHGITGPSDAASALPQPLLFPISLALEMELSDTTTIGGDFDAIMGLNPELALACGRAVLAFEHGSLGAHLLEPVGEEEDFQIVGSVTEQPVVGEGAATRRVDRSKTKSEYCFVFAQPEKLMGSLTPVEFFYTARLCAVDDARGGGGSTGQHAWWLNTGSGERDKPYHLSAPDESLVELLSTKRKRLSSLHAMGGSSSSVGTSVGVVSAMGGGGGAKVRGGSSSRRSAMGGVVPAAAEVASSSSGGGVVPSAAAAEDSQVVATEVEIASEQVLPGAAQGAANPDDTAVEVPASAQLT